MNQHQLTIFVDGACFLCAKEVQHYAKHDVEHCLNIVDISHPDFDPTAEGLDPFLVHRYFHVKTENGELCHGIPAFRAIWKRLPRYRFLHDLTQPSWVQKPMHAGYVIFAAIRPYLPKRDKGLCSDSPYCVLNDPS
tara:strand:- start:34 stop:441 length:408 start_codon:yes stop_codon:yes gene_type:complete